MENATGNGQDPVKGREKAQEKSIIARAASVVGGATMLSRVLGLLRDVITAGIIGAGGGMDAFLVAFRLPNMLRSLFAEGSLTVSFVPVFVDLEEKSGKKRADRLGREALTMLGLVLAVVVVVGVVAAPLLVKLVALGFTRDPEKFALTVELTRMVFPYIGLVALTAFMGGMLNARGVFLYPALAPVVLNICIIVSAVVLSSFVMPPVASLAYGVLAGGVCQIILQVRPLGRTGFKFKPDFRWGDPALKRVFTLMGPAVFGVAVYQINLIVSTFLASWLPDGSVSYLYYAERLFQLPLGVFAVSVGMASLPSLSRLASNEKWEEFSHTLSGSLRMLWLVVIPATAGLFLIAEPVVALIFQRGKFTPEMTIATAQALTFYSLALVPVATTRIVAQGFYAMKDTKTPVKGAFWSLWVNLAASLLLMGPLKHAGLALATAISASVNAIYLCIQYKKRTGAYPFEGLSRVVGLMVGACGVMTVFVLVAGWYFSGAASGAAGQWGRGFYVALAVIGGAGVYGISAKLLGIEEVEVLTSKIANRLLKR